LVNKKYAFAERNLNNNKKQLHVEGTQYGYL